MLSEDDDDRQNLSLNPKLVGIHYMDSFNHSALLREYRVVIGQKEVCRSCSIMNKLNLAVYNQQNLLLCCKSNYGIRIRAITYNRKKYKQLMLV